MLAGFAARTYNCAAIEQEQETQGRQGLSGGSDAQIDPQAQAYSAAGFDEQTQWATAHIALELMDDYRRACQRQHRVLGHFLAMQAWLRGVDCLVLDRRDVEAFLVLERLKEQRISWLREDVKPWFPHQHVYEQGTSGFSLHSIYLSRVAIEKWLPDGEMTTSARIAGMRRGSPKCEAFAEPPLAHRHLNELDVAKYLALLDGGLVNPEPLKSMPK